MYIPVEKGEDFSRYHVIRSCGGGSGMLNNYSRGEFVGQRGAGVGSFLKGIYRRIIPHLKRGGKEIGKAAGREALHTGINILDELATNKTPAVRESVRGIRRKAEESWENSINGSEYKKARQSPADQSLNNSGAASTSRKVKKRVKSKNPTQSHKKKKKVRTARDIFEEH